MNKTKFLTIAVILLLGINLTTLFLIFSRPPRPEQYRDPKNIIVEKLEFNNEQIKQYDVLIEEHKKNINLADIKLKSLKNELYKTLATDKFSLKDSLINQISIVQREIENIHYEHFEAIKKICKSEQIEYFNDLTTELSRIFSPVNKKRTGAKD